MNHGRSLRKLSRNTAHRRALLRNLATSLIVHNRIETTLPKAKELKRVADKLVTLGKKRHPAQSSSGNGLFAATK